MSGHEHETDHPDAAPDSTEPADGMGVSSERVGHVGAGESATDGVRDTSPTPVPDDTPPEQRPGAEEPRPDGVAPAAGYPSLDPRSEDKPYKDATP